MITSAEEFRGLRESKDAENYTRAASEEAPEAVWLDVIAKFPSMRSWVAHNKTVPLSVLRVLAQDEDCEVRVAVAAKRKLAPDRFIALAFDPWAPVRHTVACNGNCPPQVLSLLAQDGDKFVASAAAERLSK